MIRTKGKSGIYQIYNIITNKRYIGSGVDIENRWSNHQVLLRQGHHPNSHLQRSYNKYGESNFKFSVILYCRKDELIDNEQSVIDYYDASREGYNLRPTAGSNLGYRYTVESRKRMSESQKGRVVSIEQRTKISETLKGNTPWNKGRKVGASWNKGLKGFIPWNKGKKLSQEYKRKLSLAHKGQIRTEEQKKATSETIRKTINNIGGHWNRGFKHSDFTKQRISQSLKGIPKSEETRKKMSESKRVARSL